MSFSKFATDECNSYQSSNKTKSARLKSATNASRGSTSVLQRSGASPGISKDIKLHVDSNLETAEELKLFIDSQSCVCPKEVINNNTNCLLYCVPVNDAKEPRFDPLYKAILLSRRTTFTKSSKGEINERDAHLLVTVRSTIVERSSTTVKRKLSTDNQCSSASIDDTSVEVDQKFRQLYILPVAQVQNCSPGNEPLIFNTTKLCRKGFAMLHGFSVCQIERACNRLKEQWDATSITTKQFKDRTLLPYNFNEVASIFSDNLLNQNVSAGVSPFNDDMITSALLPANDNDMYVSLWLEDYFMSYGDSAPNQNVHQISATFKNEIFIEYQREMLELNKTAVDNKRFYEIWNACFPNYLVRPYVNVTGKCDLCYAIDYQRRMSTDPKKKEALRQAHILHRGGFFMPERRS